MPAFKTLLTAAALIGTCSAGSVPFIRRMQNSTTSPTSAPTNETATSMPTQAATKNETTSAPTQAGQNGGAMQPTQSATMAPTAKQNSTSAPSTAAPTQDATAAATAASTQPTGGAATSAPTSANLDVAILQFALNLEYLEAEFYSWSAYGMGLPECAATTIGGAKANLSTSAQAYAEEIATNEIAHVKFLQKALGNSSIACPALDIGPAFATAANVALNTTLPIPFSPYANDQLFLLGSFIFEDVGVTAYNGAAGLLTSKDILSAAAGILAVEAYHAATVRTLLTMARNFPLPPYMSATVAEVTDAISKLRAKLGGGKDHGITASANDTQPMDIVPPTSIVPTDDNGIAFARTVAEVENIVFFGGNKKGGFFPQGLNGSL